MVLALCVGVGCCYIGERDKNALYSKTLLSMTYGGLDITRDNRSIHIKSAILLKDKIYVALDENGKVWQWQKDETKETAKALLEEETVVKIMYAGGVAYALTVDGEVYAWGDNIIQMVNPYDNIWEYQEPVRVKGLSDIVCMDAGYGKAFAIDREGRLYAWGIDRYPTYAQDQYPSQFLEYQELIGDVEEIYLGGGNFHYFKREDGSFFSILSKGHVSNYLGRYIFPAFADQEEVVYWHETDNIIDIRENPEDTYSFLYEMGKNSAVKLLASDGYTMYMYLNDNTLWYWNSESIKYHNNEAARVSVERKDFDYSGYFEKVDLEGILGAGEDIPEIIQICPGNEWTLFLLEDGRVLESCYVTTEVKDVEYYAFDNMSYSPGGSGNLAVFYQMRLKELDFHKLEYENIINITSDKFQYACLVDGSGNIYCHYGSVDWQ
ncbi:MAG: hypothetical protein NC434_10740 [Ruminococcus sp.]|nr:hypothetical protein [Ruminococcus sp.]